MIERQMKTTQMGLFYKAITLVSFLSVASVCAHAQAAQIKPSPAKQIGFKVVDQAPVVIEGRANTAPSSNGYAPQNTSANNQAAPRASMAMEPVVEGFADKVPLTVAIQQILPQGYGYTLGDGVDAGQLVSWRGGRSWNVVLQEMLAPAALSYAANGRSIAINSVGVAPTIVTGIPPLQPVTQLMMQAAPQPMQQVMQQQPVQVVQQPQPIMMDPQPVMMQPQPQVVMQQQPVMMQPQQQVMMQQPVIMQQPVMMQQQPQVVMQQQVMEAPAMQAVSASPQPLQIENPLLFTSQTWEAKPGQTLRTILQDWCARVGAELSWTAEFDYPIMASMNMTGTFEEAVRVLLTGFDAAKPTPRGRLHYNPAAGQSILIVEADGNHYGD